MWTLDGLAIFGEGESVIRVNSVELRHDLQPSAAGSGTTLIATGREPERVTQQFRVTRDDHDAIDRVLAKARDRLDGRPRTLTNGSGRTWDRLVMLAVDAEEPTRLGPRWTTRVSIDYVQVTR